MRVVVLAALFLAVALVVALKRDQAAGVPSTALTGQAAPASAPTAAVPQNTAAARPAAAEVRADTASPTPPASFPGAAALPRLVDVGADRCIPCKAMAPILEELRQEYAGRLRIDVIDAWKHPEQAEPFDVYGIPVQIFLDPSGRELYRHVGFFSKAEILATWRRLGFALSSEKSRP